jgi:SagB-type dehydrogenase family enzyme
MMSVERDFESIAPFVAGSVAWSTDAPPRISIDLGDRVAELQGDQVAAVLSDCDGRTTIRELLTRHGKGAAEMLAALLDSGALVDGADSWKVFHRHGSAGTALGTAASEHTVLELQEMRFAPREALGASVSLPSSDGVVERLAGGRQSMTPDTAEALPDFAQLSALLNAAYSVRETEEGLKRGNNPSAGAHYPLVFHVVVRNAIGELGPGRWWLDPFAHSLHRLGDADGIEDVFVPEPGCERLLERGGPLIFVSADISRPARKYGARGYRYALIESGAAMQSAYLAATELGVPLRAIGGIDDGLAHAFLGLPDSSVALLALIVG